MRMVGLLLILSTGLAPANSNAMGEERGRATAAAHWSFQPPVPATLPEVADPDWASNPIDRFIAATHAQHGLKAQPPAPTPALIRRVYLDLIGLPPTREQLHEHLADTSPAAYQRLVDRLLQSPQYGERWARHWMDVWRYSDWYGRRMVPDVWNSAPQIWRWRDWIVQSLNSDKGYDRMVQEMIAGDEVDPTNDEAGYATGYLIRNWYALNPNDWMRSNVEHTTKAFMGLTFNCAHCHDHKYDPITQEDYFKMRAFFEPIGIRQDRVPGEADPGVFQEYNYSVLRKIVRLGGVRLYDKAPDALTWFYTGGDERNRVTDRGAIAPGLPEFLAPNLAIEPVELPTTAWYPGLRPAIIDTVLTERAAAITATQRQLVEASAAAAEALPDLRSNLAAAQAAFDQATKVAQLSGQAGAVAGHQSLLLDASAGRRVLQNSLQHIKQIDDGATISFQLAILSDAHFNFQLAHDVAKGLTAAFIAFEKGRIVSYQPGTHNEFEVGRYDPAGSGRFEIAIELLTGKDEGRLTVRCTRGSGTATLAEQVPIALNGWTLTGDATKGILLDARTGSRALVDEFRLSGPSQPGGSQPPRALVYFDFEPPAYVDDRDVIGIDGWQSATFSQGAATSQISATAGNDTLRAVAQELQSARRAIEVHELKVRGLKLQLDARSAELAGVRARLAAEHARDAASSDADVLARAASRAEREAAVRAAEAELTLQQQALAAALAKPRDDHYAKQLDAANKQLAAAQTALNAAQNALADPARESAFSPLSPTYPKKSTGRRLALARWITHRNNPLAARVAMNHIWLRHFHAPLVNTVYDFGRNGAAPTHPELLDWLAVEFMESGWSMKHMHRLIVNSNTYRMASDPGTADDPRHQADPENRLLWRMNVGRMEAEVVRDSLLHVADRLDPQMGGQELENAQALSTYRRTLYYSCNPELDGMSQLGALFDAPEPTECYRRTRSVIPQQALALTNSDLVHALSDSLVEKLTMSLSPADRGASLPFVAAVFEHLLSRAPTEAEMAMCVDYLKPAGSDAESKRLRASLVRAVLNHNDFIAIR